MKKDYDIYLDTDEDPIPTLYKIKKYVKDVFDQTCFNGVMLYTYQDQDLIDLDYYKEHEAYSDEIDLFGDGSDIYLFNIGFESHAIKIFNALVSRKEVEEQ